MDSSLRIIICLLKIPTTNATRVSPERVVKYMNMSKLWPLICCLLFIKHMQSLLDPFSKLLSFVIQYGMFSLSYLIELCGLCYKAFNKVLANVFT